MIDTLLYDGRVIELTVLFDVTADAWRLECWDLTPGDGGALFDIVEEPGGRLVLRDVRDGVPLDLLALVAELARVYLAERDGDDDAAAWRAAGTIARAATTLDDLAALVTGHGDAGVRAQAVPRLAARFRDDRRAYDALVVASGDRDGRVRAAAYRGLGDLGAPGDVHAPGLADDDPDVRVAAALALADVGDDRVPPDLDAWVAAQTADDDCGVPEVPDHGGSGLADHVRSEPCG